MATKSGTKSGTKAAPKAPAVSPKAPVTVSARVVPKEVVTLCKSAGLKVSEVAEYRVAGRELRHPKVGPAFWVVPVSVLDKQGRKYTADVIRFNE